MDTYETLLPPSMSDELLRLSDQNNHIENEFVKNIPDEEKDYFCNWSICCCFFLAHR